MMMLVCLLERKTCTYNLKPLNLFRNYWSTQVAQFKHLVNATWQIKILGRHTKQDKNRRLIFQCSSNIDVGLREQEYSKNLWSRALDGKSVSQIPSCGKDVYFCIEDAFCSLGGTFHCTFQSKDSSNVRKTLGFSGSTVIIICFKKMFQLTQDYKDA